MKFILGKKIEMTQRFKEDGVVTPVTIVAGGPCVVTQVKNTEKEGYNSVQVGFDEKRKPNNKSVAGHLKGLKNFRHLKEFRIDDETKAERGQVIKVDTFEVGDIVNVVGTSKGKGFQGVVRRHGFKGGRGSHGDKDQLRMPGSIGATDAARVFKGKRMGGHMGDDQTSVKNLEVIEIDLDNNYIFLKGAVPGARGSLLEISAPGELKISTEEEKKDKEEVKVEKKVEEPKKEEKPSEKKKDKEEVKAEKK